LFKGVKPTYPATCLRAYLPAPAPAPPVAADAGSAIVSVEKGRNEDGSAYVKIEIGGSQPVDSEDDDLGMGGAELADADLAMMDDDDIRTIDDLAASLGVDLEDDEGDDSEPLLPQAEADGSPSSSSSASSFRINLSGGDLSEASGLLQEGEAEQLARWRAQAAAAEGAISSSGFATTSGSSSLQEEVDAVTEALLQSGGGSGDDDYLPDGARAWGACSACLHCQLKTVWCSIARQLAGHLLRSLVTPLTVSRAPAAWPGFSTGNSPTSLGACLPLCAPAAAVEELSSRPQQQWEDEEGQLEQQAGEVEAEALSAARAFGCMLQRAPAQVRRSWLCLCRRPLHPQRACPPAECGCTACPLAQIWRPALRPEHSVSPSHACPQIAWESRDRFTVTVSEPPAMVRARQQQQREEEDAERQAAVAAAAAPQLQRPPLRIIYDGKEQQQQRKRQQPQQPGDGSPEGSSDNPSSSNGASGSGLSLDGSIDVEVTSDEGSSSDSEEISVLLSQQQARARQLQLEREQGMQDPQDPQPQPPQQPPSFQQQQGEGGLGSSGLQDNVAEDSAALAEQIEALREDFEAGRKPSKDQLNEIGE
jgi:hypothetical protein